MKDFRDIQKLHEQLLNKQQSDLDITKGAQDFLKEAKIASSSIADAKERDQLRSNIRYWASYIYEKTGIFPNVELPPPTTKAVTQQKRWRFMTLIFILFLISLFVVFFTVSTYQIKANVEATVSYAQEATLAQVATQLFSITPSSTFSPATPSESNNISVTLTYPQNGQIIPPELTLKGQYSNLSIGQSICVFVQPLSKGGKIYPLSDCYTVLSQTFGNWSIDVRFGNAEELTKPEKYILIIGIVPDEQNVAMIKQSNLSGFDQMPTGVLTSPQSVTVARPGYDVVNETRIIFSNYIPSEFNIELFSTKLDGTDLRRLTYTNSINEFYPSLSPDGKKIAMVGVKFSDFQTNSSYQLIVMESDGSSITVISAEKNVRYDHPLWSPDSKYIAYAVGFQDEVFGLFWRIYLFDTETKTSKMFQESKYPIRDFTWSPSGALVFADRGKITGTYDFFAISPENLNPNDSTIYYNPNTEDTKPAISPDDKYVAYVVGNLLNIVEITTKRNIVVKNIANDGEGRVSSYPTWSSDSKTVFFTRILNDVTSIWSVNVDGESLKKILDFGSEPYVGFLNIFLPKP